MRIKYVRYAVAVLTYVALFSSRDTLGASLAAEKSILDHVCQGLPGAFTLEVEVDLPVAWSLLGQGDATRSVRVTRGNNVTAIVWNAVRLPVPKYSPPGNSAYQQGDYDAEGNLIIAMWSAGATIRNSTINEEYSESRGFLVAPNGTILRENPGITVIDRRRPSESNTLSLNLLHQVFWALGRPLRDSIGEVLSEVSEAKGGLRVRTSGGWAPSVGTSGVCDISIEPGDGYLVRRASFGADGQQPRASCISEGTRRFGNIVLADRGEFRLLPGVQTISVRLISFKPGLDTDLIAEARKVISRARTRLVQVFDYREDTAHPKVRLVQAGDLDKDQPAKSDHTPSDSPP